MTTRTTSALTLSFLIALPPALAQDADTLTRPITEKRIDGIQEGGFRRVPASRVKKLLGGPQFVLWRAVSSPPRLLVGVFKQKKRGPRGTWLLDADSGKVLARTGRPTRRHHDGGYQLVFDRKGRNALLRLEDGRVLVPQARLPDGRAVGPARILVDAGCPHIWVLADGPDGKMRYGLWTEPDAHPGVTLTGMLPCEPEAFGCNRGAGAVEAFVPYPRHWPQGQPPDPTGCARYRLLPGVPPVCRVPEGSDKVGPMANWLSGDWIAGNVRRPGQLPGDPFGTCYLYDTNSRSKSMLPGMDTPGQMMTALIHPPRVLAVARLPERTAVTLWSPEKTWWWDEPTGDWMSRYAWISNVLEPVFPLIGHDDTVDTWLDLERGVKVSAPPLRQAGFGSSGRLPLAFSKDDKTGRIQLVLLDLERDYSARHIASYDDCKRGTLWELARTAKRVAVACQIQKRPGLHVFRYKWTEVIDLEAKTRRRLRGTAEAILKDGRVIVTNRRRAAAESYSACQSIGILPP